MLALRGLGRVLGDLSELGYHARWGVLGAHHANAPHKRERIWILAYTTSQRGCSRNPRREYAMDAFTCRESKHEDAEGVSKLERVFSNASEQRLQRSEQEKSSRIRTLQKQSLRICGEWWQSDPSLGLHREPVVFGCDTDADTCLACGEDYATCPCIGPSEDDVEYYEDGNGILWGERIPITHVDRVAHGVANRVDRLKAIGNGQVPLCAATAWRLLNDEK